jgi:hypothetical protein
MTGLSSRKRRRALDQQVPVLMALLLLITVAGCGPRSDRLAISGEVTLNGVPLDAGSIRFSSVPGEKLYATGAMVKDGDYRIPQAKGLPPGRYRVEINSPDLKAIPVATRPAPGEPLGPPTAPERIPPEYNTNSTQTVEVTAGEDNQFKFDITNAHTK